MTEINNTTQYVDKEVVMQKLLGTVHSTQETVKEIGCNLGYSNLFFFIILPLIFLVIVLWIMFNQKLIKKIIEDWKLKNNYIKIKMIGENKSIKTHLILMDKYNKFNFNERSYTLEDIQKYVIGYEKGKPLLLYDKRFIFPLVLSEYTVKQEAMKELGLTDEDLEKDITGELKNKINALYLKVDSALLNTVYRKKLISDLYDASKEMKIDPMIYYIGFGVIALVVLYLTGALEPILESLGVNLGG